MCIRMPMTSDARSKRPGADAMRSKNSCTLKDTGAPRRVQLHQFAAQDGNKSMSSYRRTWWTTSDGHGVVG